jgi:hypothetical protein
MAPARNILSQRRKAGPAMRPHRGKRRVKPPAIGHHRGIYVRSTSSMMRSSWFSVLQTLATLQKRLYWSIRESPWPQ